MVTELCVYIYISDCVHVLIFITCMQVYAVCVCIYIYVATMWKFRGSIIRNIYIPLYTYIGKCNDPAGVVHDHRAVCVCMCDCVHVLIFICVTVYMYLYSLQACW